MDKQSILTTASKANKGSRKKVDAEHLSHKVEFASQRTYDVSIDLPPANCTTDSVPRSIRVKRDKGEAISYSYKLPCCYYA
ncbi:hypothetical protein HanIR_Chr12g0606891 [Helianthus annuus]|nr:hypothetical protein HanIR_Chr12g0606891 [Helianthus annuus]